MKKHIFLVCITALLVCACAKKQQSANTETADSTQVSDNSATALAAEPEPSIKEFIITPQGVGSLKFGKPFNDMSQSDEGLYNRVIKETEYEEYSGINILVYTLFLNDVKVAEFRVCEENSPIEKLTVTSPYVSSKNGIKVGMPVREAMTNKGLKADATYDAMEEMEIGAWISLSGDGISCSDYYWGGSDLSKKGEQRVRSMRSDGKEHIDLGPDDFKADSKVPCFHLTIN